MKKTIILFILITASFIYKSYSQNMNRGKIYALKTTYITQYLDLTKSEAEKFWPIYNEFSKKERSLRFQKQNLIDDKIKTIDGVEKLSDNEATILLNSFIEIDNKLITLKSNLIKDLKNVISPKKIIKLHIAENKFNKNMLQQLRRRQMQNDRN